MINLFSMAAPDPAGPNEKKTKRKKRREKRKLINRHLKSAETSDNYMSELPFSLTSPTTWKELGCVYIPDVILIQLRVFSNSMLALSL